MWTRQSRRKATEFSNKKNRKIIRKMTPFRCYTKEISVADDSYSR